MPEQTPVPSHPVSVAAVVPVWLQDALAVLLKSSQNLRLVACTATVQTLLLLALEEPPAVVILDADEHTDRATNQVKQIQAVWPESRCLVLVEHKQHEGLMKMAGADEILQKGTPPRQLVDSICQTAVKNNT